MCYVTPEPRDELFEAELIGFVEGGDENVGLLRIGRETRAVDGEEGIRGREGRSLVAVNEGMVLRETLPERGSLPRSGQRNNQFAAGRGRLPATPDP